MRGQAGMRQQPWNGAGSGKDTIPHAQSVPPQTTFESVASAAETGLERGFYSAMEIDFPRDAGQPAPGTMSRLATASACRATRIRA